MASTRSSYGTMRGVGLEDESSPPYIPPTTTTTAPDYGSALMGDYYGNIQSALSGEVPQDVQNQISTAAAEYGIMTGMPGSQLAGYAGLRNLGLTSLARQDWAAKMLQPNIASELDINRLKTQAELEQQNWMQRYEAQLAEKRREEYLNRNLGGGTPPIIQGRAPAPMYAPTVGNTMGGYRSYGGGLGTGGLGTFGTPAPTSNQAVMQSIMDEYGQNYPESDMGLSPLSSGTGVTSYNMDWTIPGASPVSNYAADADIYNPNYWTGDFGEGIYG